MPTDLPEAEQSWPSETDKAESLPSIDDECELL